ncbi:unnamed protein product, partial [Bubo scandiacus]
VHIYKARVLRESSNPSVQVCKLLFRHKVGMDESGSGKETLRPVQLGQCREEGHRHLAWGQLGLLSPGNKIFSLVLDSSGATQPPPSPPRRTQLNKQAKNIQKILWGESVKAAARSP